ncbi:hypothetical protein GUJ93_ZPchr0011g28229 [Zizania palustris]|uniref:Uncharacterized protein n=1 Tax=Zizania palustris TaxID=103762 RepID=A0A8J5WGM7_ZIZPA|nr:hypothetical protein GUJ93_ZPchr0011g28229 [Zizania palustris]
MAGTGGGDGRPAGTGDTGASGRAAPAAGAGGAGASWQAGPARRRDRRWGRAVGTPTGTGGAGDAGPARREGVYVGEGEEIQRRGVKKRWKIEKFVGE